MVERRHLDINQFFLFSGMIPGTGAVSLRSGAIATLSIDWLGKIGTRKDQASLQNPKPAPTADVMNCAGDVLQIVGGAAGAVASLGTLQTFTLSMSNNLRGIKGIGIVGNADVKEGQFGVTGSFEAYFEDGTIFDAAKNQTPWDLAFVISQDNQAYVWDAPKTKFTAEIVAGQRNQDCVVRASFQALKEATLGACVIINRLPYYR